MKKNNKKSIYLTMTTKKPLPIAISRPQDSRPTREQCDDYHTNI